MIINFMIMFMSLSNVRYSSGSRELCFQMNELEVQIHLEMIEREERDGNLNSMCMSMIHIHIHQDRYLLS